MPTYSQLFFVMTTTPEFDTRWDDILLSMEQVPPDDILESLYKLRIREIDKLKTVLELYNLDIRRSRNTEVGSCSNFPTEAVLWIKEVEMASSVGDFKSSRSTQGITSFLDFELLDGRIASSLNKIIQNSYIKRKFSLEEPKASSTTTSESLASTILCSILPTSFLFFFGMIISGI